MKKKTIISIDYNELDKLVKENYKQKFEVVEDLELSNDSDKLISVSKEKLSIYEEANIRKFVDTGHYNWTTHTLLKDMCNKGIIEEGDYLIKVSW